MEQAFGVMTKEEIENLINQAQSLATQLLVALGKDTIKDFGKGAENCATQLKELKKVLNTLDEATKNLFKEL